MCVTTQHVIKQTRMKVDPLGLLCMFVSYATVHAGDVYHFVHSETNQIIYSHDVQWLNKF